MLVNMSECVRDASQSHRIVPGFNVFGYEDALAVIHAAEKFNAPVILMSNSDAVEHMDLNSTVALFRNIASTQRVLALARKNSVSVEAELGSVPYTDRNEEVQSILTNADEARKFTAEAPVDALAVAVGSLHRMQTKLARIDFNRLEEIECLTDVPLVIHGTSGIVDDDVKKLLSTNVGKMNIGTALRMAFGRELKEQVLSRPDEFDRVKLFKKPMSAVQAAAEEKYRLLGWKETR